MKEYTVKIIGELYRTLVLLGADSELLGTVGSWCDCLPEEEVLSGLRVWNQAALEKLKACIVHYEVSHPRSDCSRDEDQKRVAEVQ
jgi:hypothetical protein